MDEKKISEEFASIWKTIGENAGGLLENTKDIQRIVNTLREFKKTMDHNADYGNAVVEQFNRVKANQKLFIALGIAGYFFLSVRIKKLEDSTKKE